LTQCASFCFPPLRKIIDDSDADRPGICVDVAWGLVQQAGPRGAVHQWPASLSGRAAAAWPTRSKSFNGRIDRPPGPTGPGTARGDLSPRLQRAGASEGAASALRRRCIYPRAAGAIRTRPRARAGVRAQYAPKAQGPPGVLGPGYHPGLVFKYPSRGASKIKQIHLRLLHAAK
jgi:hypothetical protein